jgi:peptidoglycan/LPS O-acetylase OafA/YrhL
LNDIYRIRHLDVWPFISVSMVILSHLIGSNFSFLATIVPGASRLVRFGNFAVLIFFFISGFVICRGFIDEGKSTSLISLKAFYLRRACRILPPLMLYLATLMGLGAAGAINIQSSQIAISALFLSNLFSDEFPWVLVHT